MQTETRSLFVLKGAKETGLSTPWSVQVDETDTARRTELCFGATGNHRFVLMSVLLVTHQQTSSTSSVALTLAVVSQLVLDSLLSP